jgi:nucleoside-diphosphate-sugar epimerase
LRVLIIGGTRFIGAHAARQLVEAGADVSVFHRGKSDNPVLPGSATHIRDPLAEYPITRFPDSVTKTDWDAVIHMVMMGAADGRAAAAFAGRAGRLVMVSSGDVYRAYGRLTGLEPGEPDAVPLKEDAPLRGVHFPYRAQAARLGAYATDYEKILAEQEVRALPGLPAVVLRLPKVYGPEDNGNLATVYGFAGEPQWRWTHGHVENVARAIVLAATNRSALGRVYNVGEEYTPTMAERLAVLPARAAAATPRPFNYRQAMVCDTGRIRSELGYADLIDEAQAMLEMAQAL